MSASAVVLIGLDPQRRKSLAQGLTRRGYEVAPARDIAQGAQYLQALEPQVVVLPVEDLAHPDLVPYIGADAPRRRTVVALGRASEEGRVPRRVAFLATEGLTPEAFLDRLLLVLLGRDLDLVTDAEVTGLLGQLSTRPLFELLPALGRNPFRGVLELPNGQIYVDGGQPVAARSGEIDGLKAFCRLVTTAEGTFRLRPTESVPATQWREDLDALMALALEDSLGEMPDPRMRVKVEVGPELFSHQFTPLQQEVLQLARNGIALGRLLDSSKVPDGQLMEQVLELESLGVVKLLEPEAGVAVVTDSCCDLPRDLVHSLGVEVVPLTVTFGRQAYLDGVDLSPGEFFQQLATNPEHPFTNPPPRKAFEDCFQRLLPRKDVVTVHISEKLSQTVVHAREAAGEALLVQPSERDDGRPVQLEVVDSRQSSLAQGMLVVFAARMAERGLPAPEIARRLQEMRDRIDSFFVVDTLEYLVRGNRIGRARALLGSLLGIKPILGIADGEVVALDKVRGGRNAHRRILELAQEQLEAGAPVMATIAHSQAPVWADRLRKIFLETFRVAEMIVSEMGPVIGTHVGPGTVGLGIFQPTESELELIRPLEPDAES
ncbi:MAG: DegV family protein [Acidobacteriota bacterium]|nr:DegV family protein [Acidobacteriota bacterium]